MQSTVEAPVAISDREKKRFKELRKDWKTHKLYPFPQEIDLLIELVERAYDLHNSSPEA